MGILLFAFEFKKKKLEINKNSHCWKTWLVLSGARARVTVPLLLRNKLKVNFRSTRETCWCPKNEMTPCVCGSAWNKNRIAVIVFAKKVAKERNPRTYVKQSKQRCLQNKAFTHGESETTTRILRHDHSPISSWTKNEQVKRRRKTQNKNRTEPSMLHSQNLISRPAWSCNSWTPQWTRAPSQHARSNTQNGCCDHCSTSTTSSNNNNGTPFQKPV